MIALQIAIEAKKKVLIDFCLFIPILLTLDNCGVYAVLSFVCLS